MLDFGLGGEDESFFSSFGGEVFFGLSLLLCVGVPGSWFDDEKIFCGAESLVGDFLGARPSFVERGGWLWVERKISRLSMGPSRALPGLVPTTGPSAGDVQLTQMESFW